ncbi:hypothetical protein AWW66_16640 [Micromonospora rosaria]|uniref:EcsC family protein n=2 Tax=Micromonospora rosaria TaxID=47874 RepID=A0A136PRR1_9ACTN|nr:hypothetical protein AWW66_16640 [Micromonospora rosaria]
MPPESVTGSLTAGTAPVGPSTPPDIAQRPENEPPDVAQQPRPADVAQRPDGEPTEVHRPGSGPADGRTGGGDLRWTAGRLRDRPELAPELLALAAVEVRGPAARAWVDEVRAVYPQADAAGLARLATARFVRRAGVGGAAATTAGLLAPAVEVAAVLWAQADLVLHLAAAYGRDPGHPDRAVELLVLTRVHADSDRARAALDAARAAARDPDGGPRPAAGPWPSALGAAWRLAAPLTGGEWLPVRLAARLLPGAAVLAAAAGADAATRRLAARAVAAYRAG